MGFKISMTNPVSMHVFDGAEELFEEEFGMHLAVMSQFVDNLEHFLTVNKFHYDVCPTFTLEAIIVVDVELMHFYNVVMAQLDHIVEFDHHLKHNGCSCTFRMTSSSVVLTRFDA